MDSRTAVLLHGTRLVTTIDDGVEYLDRPYPEWGWEEEHHEELGSYLWERTPIYEREQRGECS